MFSRFFNIYLEKLNRQYTHLFRLLGKKFKKASIGLFTNQIAFDFTEKKYLAQILSEDQRLEVLFLPEHGFFSELQDQDDVDDRVSYFFLKKNTKVISLYGKSKGFEDERLLDDLNLIIIDIQDIGSRYYTYVTTIAQLLELISRSRSKPSVILIDHPNLAGRQIEGTAMTGEYTSLIGWKGIPHRYGLTLGELAMFIQDQTGGDSDLEVIKYGTADVNTIPINPSPNIPGESTLRVFTGQCLFEGTNVSEGRGTTRPFEIFGAPFLSDLSPDWLRKWNYENTEAVLRPLIFIPTFHKYRNRQCFGFQLHPVERHFHSLFYSLKLIRELKHKLNGFRWLDGPYESGSDRSAIEILVGDKLILEYLNRNYDHDFLKNYLKSQEETWIEKTAGFLLYDHPLYSI